MPGAADPARLHDRRVSPPAPRPPPQSNLRKQFYGDLVDLRGALLNTMSVAPHRASSLHIKMHLIDSALHMLEVGAAAGAACGRSSACTSIMP